MVKTNESFSDELLSAYLDDEVSSTERELIERKLQQDARCRQLYEELRGVREAMQALPPQRLGQGFAARVMQRIRELHASDMGGRQATAAAPSRLRNAPTPRGFRRGLVWAALATAAAVLLMVFQPPEAGDVRQVVSVPATDQTAGQPSEPTESRRAVPDEVHLEESREDATEDFFAFEPLAGDGRPPADVSRGTSSRRMSADLPSQDDPAPPLPGIGSPPTDLRQEEGLGDRASPKTDGSAQSPEQLMPMESAGAPPFRALLLVDVTDDQLPEIMARLRQERLTIIEELTDRFAAGRDATWRGVGQNTPDGDRLDRDTPTAISATTRVRGFLVQGEVEQVQGALRRVHVVARSAVPAELERASKEWGRAKLVEAFEVEREVAPQRTQAPASPAASRLEPSAEAGPVLVLFNMVPSPPAVPTEAAHDEQD